jgi:NAD(P)H-hydrate epimerase
MSQDFEVNFNIANSLKLPICFKNDNEDINKLRDEILIADLVVDAIFGTGLKREVTDIFFKAIAVINENSPYTLAIDVPSGMDADSGAVLGLCIKASKTVTLQCYKRGFLNYAALNFLGEIKVEPIGIPEFAVDRFYEKEELVEEDKILKALIKKSKIAHKGKLGRAVLIAGSKDFSGAAYISASAAVKTGAGLVTLCCPENIQQIMSIKLVEAMTAAIEGDRFKEVLLNSDAIAFGPGMGNNLDTLNKLKQVLSSTEAPLVIDADGLNVLENNLSLLKGHKQQLIFTPHLGEFSRLTGISIKDIEENRLETAKKFAKEHKLILLLKGYNTIVTDGEHTYINTTGNSAMANGGMGDCLTGIITSLLAQGYEPIKAAYLGAYIHGLTGDLLAKKQSVVNASQVIEKLPYVIKNLENVSN